MSSVPTQQYPPGRSTRAISVMATVAASCPPKCSMELSEYTTSKLSSANGRAEALADGDEAGQLLGREAQALEPGLDGLAGCHGGRTVPDAARRTPPRLGSPPRGGARWLACSRRGPCGGPDRGEQRRVAPHGRR